MMLNPEPAPARVGYLACRVVMAVGVAIESWCPRPSWPLELCPQEKTTWDVGLASSPLAVSPSALRRLIRSPVQRWSGSSVRIWLLLSLRLEPAPGRVGRRSATYRDGSTYRNPPCISAFLLAFSGTETGIPKPANPLGTFLLTDVTLFFGCPPPLPALPAAADSDARSSCQSLVGAAMYIY